MTLEFISTKEVGERHPSESKRAFLSIPKRIVVVVLSFFGVFTTYTMRANMSVVLVAMVNSINARSWISRDNFSVFSNETMENKESDTEITISDHYNWDSKTQGTIMGAFFYAYFITLLCGGYLAERFGAKRMFGGGVLITALLTLLTPVAIRCGYASLIIVRCLVGISEGVVWPSLIVVISRWSPKSERSRISASIFNGAPLGIVAGLLVAGWLSSLDFLGGWPSVFYVFGSMSCIWSILWFSLISETPQQHPTITFHELSLYSSSEGQINKGHKVPWKSIFTSLPVWSAFLANFGMFFGAAILLTELPTYLSTVLHFNLTTIGLLSTLPYIIEPFGGWVSSCVADKLRNSGRLDISTIRKIMNSIAAYGLSVCFIAMGLAGYRPYLIITFLCVGMLASGCKLSGFIVIHSDMSPDFSGTTFGLCNGLSSLTGIIGPAMVGAFTEKGATISTWGKVFYVTAAIQIVTATFFALFASAELQPWGEVENAHEEGNKVEKGY